MASAYNGTPKTQGGKQPRIDTPLRLTQSTSNAIRPTSPDFAPPAARANTQAHQVYSSPISTVSRLCGTSELDEDDPNTNRPASATVCTKLKPIAARFTHSQPGVRAGVRDLSILLLALPTCMSVLLFIGCL